jgi:hypothetical protein
MEKPNVRKKGWGRKEEVKIKRLVKKVETYSIVQTPPTFPLATKFELPGMMALYSKHSMTDMERSKTGRKSARVIVYLEGMTTFMY